MKEETSSVLHARHGRHYRWLLLVSVMVGTIASIMSSTIVNVAIPDLSHHFAIGQERAQWVTSGFMVATTVAMLTTPWLLANFGYRRTYVGTMLVLLAGGVAGGLGTSFGMVLAARVAQGLAAGVVQPIPAVIIMHTFKSDEQGRAGGVFGMGVVLAPAIGPSIGGVLVDLFGWRSIFFMVVPFCLASLWLARRYVPVSAPGDAKPGSTRLDWQGLALASAGIVCLLNGLVQLHDATHVLAAGLLLAAAGLLASFVGWQLHQTQRDKGPLVDLRLFKHKPFAMGSLVAVIYGTALFGSTYLLPLYIKTAQGLSATLVGTILLPAGIALAITIPLAGRLADTRPTRVLVIAGLALLAASFALMITVPMHAAIWLLALWAVLGRIGLGFILPSLNSGSMRGLAPQLYSQGSSAINFVRMLGGAIGVSLCGIVLQLRLAAHGDSLTGPAPNPARLAAFEETFAALAAVCALAIVAAWQLRAPPRRRAQQPGDASNTR